MQISASNSVVCRTSMQAENDAITTSRVIILNTPILVNISSALFTSTTHSETFGCTAVTTIYVRA